MITIRIQNDDFDIGAEVAKLSADGAGAVATFTGTVRPDDGIDALTLEHYPQMTEREISRIVEDARNRWPLLGITIIHRVGRLTTRQKIVFVGVAAAHRGAAFRACEMLIDYLKTKAPFWKQEERGAAITWVEARHTDEQAAGRWRKE